MRWFRSSSDSQLDMQGKTVKSIGAGLFAAAWFDMDREVILDYEGARRRRRGAPGAEGHGPPWLKSIKRVRF